MTDLATIPPEQPEVQSVTLNGSRYYFPFAHLFPPLTADERAALKAAIAEQGIQNPIIVCRHGANGFDVLDGQHRLEIAIELNLAHVPQNVQSDALTNEQRYMLALTMNLARRHLTKEQRQHVVVELRKMGESYRSIAEKLMISEGTARGDAKAAGAQNYAPATVTGKDGKAYPATAPEISESEIAIVRDLVAEVLPSWTKPIEAGHITNAVRRRPGGAGVSVRAVRAALERMIEAGNVVKLKNAQNCTVYALTHDPAIKPIQTVQQRNAEAKKREIASAVIEVLMVATGPMTYREVETAVNARLGHIVNPGIFSGVITEMRRENRIRAVAGGRYALPVPDAEQPGESLAPEEETDATAWLNTPVVKEKQPEPTAALVPATEPPANGNSSIHFSSESAEWYTPPSIIERVVEALGDIDLDPCSNSHTAPHVPAKQHYAKEDDGLSKEWSGAVYMNPPYGREIAQWVEKLVAEHKAGRVTSAIALVPARTDTAWFAALRDYPRCFIAGRLTFLKPDGSEADPAPFPSCAIYIGPDLDRFAEHFASLGDIYVRYTPEG